jgi:DNA polymerase I
MELALLPMTTKSDTTVSEKKKGAVKTLVLLDTHAILHRAYHALPDFVSPSGEPTGALFGVVAMLLKIIEELKPDFIVACYDLPEPTHRHVAFDAYKAGRAKTDDALVAQIIRSRDIFAAFGIPMYEHPGFEADDILGTIVENTKKVKKLRTIIASGDMDTLQLVDKDRVLVYTLKKGIQDTILYNEDAVRARFGFGPELIPDYKGLRGDPSDNIPGIRGIGEKSGSDLITNFGSIESIYKTLKKHEEVFYEKGIKKRIVELLRDGEEEAIFSKMLATIRRDAPISFVVPTSSWHESLDTEKVLALFQEFGFRTLTQRVKTLLGNNGREMAAVVESSNRDAAREERAALALWLLSSDTTNPTYDDVMGWGRSEGVTSFDETEKRLMSSIEEEGLTQVLMEIEYPLISILHRMEGKGVKIDVPYLESLSKTMHTELLSLEKRIYAHAGVEFNINSPKQLGDVLYDTIGLKPKNQKRTATGQRSTKESELEKLAGEHPIITDILRFRELGKLLGTYIDTIPTMVRDDGRLHTTFLQAGSVTGRMASKDPGIQNIPIRTEEGRAIRRAFIAEEGYSLVSIDYSQIELRIAAILSGDEKLLEIFRSGEDVHRGVASRVFHVAPESITPDMRRRAKVINFGILYGMGVNALRTNLGPETTREEAQEFLNAYFNTFTRLAEYLEETKQFARTHGYTQTFFGRKRHFPGINSSLPFMRAQAERMAINAPVQGTSADVTRIAMVRIGEDIQKRQIEDEVRMLIQVHDELVFEIRNECLDREIPLLMEQMESVMTERDTQGITLSVEAKIGKNWADMEKCLQERTQDAGKAK